jgi:hypothetical protein
MLTINCLLLENVFSIVGLTIAKDRARLASDTANELIFLHDALHAIYQLNEAQRLQVILVFAAWPMGEAREIFLRLPAAF